MEMKDTISSCSVSKEQEIHRLQEKARLSKGGCMSSLKALQSHFTSLSDDLKDFGGLPTFKRTFFQDTDVIEKHFTKEILHQINCKTALIKLRTMFENSFNSKLKERIQKYNVYNAQSLKDTMTGDVDFIKKYMLETILHQQAIMFMSFFGVFVQDKMSRDVIMVGSTMRIPLLYKVSLAGTAKNAPPTLKDPKFWTAEEKKTRKIDRLARSLLIQGLPNDIYSLIDNNENAKDLWDAFERQMRGSEYGEQDRKAAILYEYETFKATEEEQLLDTYLSYLQVINDLKKCGYKKDNCDVNDALGYKKKAIVVTSDPLALVAEKTKLSKRKEKVKIQSESEGSDDEDISDLKKITALLAKAFNRKKYYAKLTNNNLRTSSASSSANKKPEYEINANMVFMAQIEKVLSDSDKSSSSAEENIAKVAYYTYKSESESEFETSEYYDNSTNYGLLVNDDDDQEIFHDAIESTSENFIENHIDSQKDYDKSEVDHNDSKEKEHLVDKLIRKFNHKIAKC
nr:hypothetical protein [Tanacetum cinerariifolium]